MSILENLLTNENILKLVATLIVGILTVLTAYLVKIWYSYKFFKKLGIKTPPYKFFWGNFPDIRNNKDYSDVLRKWTEKYGKTYGYYEGHLPILVTSDVNLIEEIFVKQFSNFCARKKFPLQFDDDYPAVSLLEATKGKWKRMRNVMNPTFSSAKLKEYNPQMKICTERLIKKLTENSNREINITEFLKKFTMDIIWNCGFGIDTDSQNESKHPYFIQSEKAFQNVGIFPFPFYLGVYFHEFKSAILKTLVFIGALIMKFKENKEPFIWIRQQIMNLSLERIKNKNVKKKDYIQFLVDSAHVQKTQNDSSDDMQIEKRMSEEEIGKNLSVFLLAGYETTSSALSYSIHVLATHPEEQQKLINEINEYFPDDSDETPNYDNIQNLKYLDMFFKEVLRMYPIGNTGVNRRCINPTEIKELKIPIDLAISIDVMSVHYDKDIWGPEDPNQFYPLRFSPDRKRHPMAFLAFGEGPRLCIGMKFALFEAKIALIKILKDFEILPTENMKLEFIEYIVRVPKNGIKIKLKPRVF